MSKNNTSGKVFLVGAGPGDPGLLTLKAAAALRGADVLLYDYLASDAIVSLASPDCEKIYVGKRAGQHTLAQDQIESLMIEKARAGKRVVRLKGGDPFVFGRGGEEAQALREAGIGFEIVPGISSALAAPAYAGIPITHRDHNTAFTVVTGHEDPTKPETTIDWSKLADPHQTLILLMAMGNLAGITAQLRTHGLPATTPVAVIREGTRPTQQTLVATLGTLVDEVERTGIGAPAIVVIGDVVKVREQIAWFDTAPLFGKRILVTRPTLQAAEFAQQICSRGAQAIIASTIGIEPANDMASIHEAIAHVGEYGWIVFSSVNGVSAFFDQLHRLGRDTRALSHAKVAAVGPKTAQALNARGVIADLVPPTFISEDVARELLERASPKDHILIVRAQEGRDVLESILSRHGCDVRVICAYKTVVIDSPQTTSAVTTSDILTFTSASSVNGFVHNLHGTHLAQTAGKLIACIGPVTAQAAQECGLQVDVVADEYTADGLLDALERHLTSSTGLVSAR
ncbi:MAG: uroporphyrinogen-III C-methyltransferase [Candidatus Eremiobacteraeota bacterium]|nr:uroporphyrinogen-III C-methyltransferase [Candidatus Eremiobacteraeota bacterium]